MMTRLKAQILLAECHGDDIWSIELCQQKGIPETWIEELVVGYESGFQSDRQTIYYEGRPVNQFEGIRDVDLALKLGEFLGVNTDEILPLAPTRRAIILKLQEAVEEG